MNDVARMSVNERVGNLRGIAQDDFSGQTVAFKLLERVAGHKFHDDKNLIGSFANFENGADMRMVECGGHAGFVEEALAGGGIGEEIGGQDFDSYVAVKLLVARAINFAHATGADFLEDF